MLLGSRGCDWRATAVVSLKFWHWCLFLGSSAVEHSTVNRMVAGSNPARGASSLRKGAGITQRCESWFARTDVKLVVEKTAGDAPYLQPIKENITRTNR